MVAATVRLHLTVCRFSGSNSTELNCFPPASKMAEKIRTEVSSRARSVTVTQFDFSFNNIAQFKLSFENLASGFLHFADCLLRDELIHRCSCVVTVSEVFYISARPL